MKLSWRRWWHSFPWMVLFVSFCFVKAEPAKQTMSISGRVLGADESPAPGATASLIYFDETEYKEAGPAKTGPDGRFRFENPGYAVIDRQGQLAYVGREWNEAREKAAALLDAER